MTAVLRARINAYPRQFWLMFFGMTISTIGASMIWPFLMIYASERLNQPLTLLASLLTLNSAMGLISSLIAGPVIDRFGRKWVMVVSLLIHGMAYFGLGRASTLPSFALLMAVGGAFNPLYRVGADAMMADLVPPHKRTDAYSLLRFSNNAGVAIGPAVGGFIATVSYNLAFYFASAGLMIYGLLLAVFSIETLPVLTPEFEIKRQKERFGGYLDIIKDGHFMAFIGVFILVTISATLVWLLLGVYAKNYYGVSESLYGWIPTTNALMVVFFQLSITRITRRYPPLSMLAIGALFYALAVGGIAFTSGFWGFWVCMIILTIGELILAPTSTTYAANLAPVDMRGRYMGIYGLTWGIAAGTGPVFGGVLSDTLSPKAPWIGGSVIGLVSAALFLILSRRKASGSFEAAP